MDAGGYASGETVTITVEADERYVLDEVIIDGVTYSCGGSSTFSRAVTITDHDIEVEVTGHRVLFYVFHGDDCSVSPGSGPAGTTIYVTVPPRSNAACMGITVYNLEEDSSSFISEATEDSDGALHFSFILPEADVEVSAAWIT